MKYLSNRDEFLKRSLVKIDEYRNIEDEYAINEEAESGPFANDIPWNDSLLGRLINSTIRKAKIGANLVRIKAVNKRLKEAFDDLLNRSYTSELSNEDKAKKNKVTIYAFLETLKNSVEEIKDKNDEEAFNEIPTLINLTEVAILEIKEFTDKTPAEELSMDKDDLDKLVKSLEGFLDFLKSLKKDNKEEEPSEVESESEPEDNKAISEEFYKNTITMLNSVVSLCDVVKSNKINYKQSSTGTQSSVKKEEPVKTNFKEKPVSVEVQAESLFYENESLPIFESTLDASEVKSINAWNKVKKAYTTSGIANMITRIQELIKNSEGGDNVELYKKTISKIGYQVVMNEQTIGKNRMSVDNLVKEELNPTSENDIPKSISLFGNVILAFKEDLSLATPLTEASKPIKDFITSYDKLKELLPKLKSNKNEEKEGTIESENDVEIGKYYNYTNKKGENKKVLAVDKDKVVYPGDDKKYLTSDDKKGDTLDNKDLVSVATDKSAGTFAVNPSKLRESVISRYFDFIKEAEENTETEEKVTTEKGDEVSEPVVMTTAQKISDYWEKKIDIKSFVVSRSEREKIISAFDKASKNKSIVIDGLDPIIEIVKVFNRAYKLHTTQVIPTGRSGGKVSNKTFREYTSFGGGTPDSAGASGGPYRNNAIFNSWENAVQDIKKDTNYQKIFRQETTLKTAEGNVIKDAGKNLLRFMNDMLDGDTLYKTDKSGKGKQAEFIEKYFNANVDEKKLGYDDDAKENAKIAESIKVKNLNFTNKPIKFDKYEDLKGSLFAVATNDNKQIYFYIQDLQNGNFYISYCRSMYFFEKYIKESGNSIELGTGDLPFGIKKSKETEGKEFKILAFKIKPESLISKDGKFLLSGKYTIKPISKYAESRNKAPKANLSDESEIDIKSMFTLQDKSKDKDGKEISKRFILSKAGNSITTNGGFLNIASENDINKTSIVKK